MVVDVGASLEAYKASIGPCPEMLGKAAAYDEIVERATEAALAGYFKSYGKAFPQ